MNRTICENCDVTTWGNIAGQPPGGEHGRFARYQRDLARVCEEGELGLLAAVLRDPDQGMAESAVAGHFDRRTVGLLADARFPVWARSMAQVVAGREFLTRDLHEWELLRSVAVGGAWTAEEIASASDWFQGKAAATASRPPSSVCSPAADEPGASATPRTSG